MILAYIKLLCCKVVYYKFFIYLYFCIYLFFVNAVTQEPCKVFAMELDG